VCWHVKTRLESGPVTADLTITFAHSSKLLINDVKPDHSLTPSAKMDITLMHWIFLKELIIETIIRFEYIFTDSAILRITRKIYF